MTSRKTLLPVTSYALTNVSTYLSATHSSPPILNKINIIPQGSAALSFGIQINRIENPNISERLRRNTTFDFDSKIQMNVVGTIGDKMRVGINYDTEATFEFENKAKLQYSGEEDEIIKTDLAFSACSEEYGVATAFIKYADSECVLLRDGGLPLVGETALKEHLEKNPASNITMTWAPLFAEGSASGDLGYTYGTYAIRSTAKPEEILSEGCYVSIWKKQSDGSWKWSLDSGTEGLTE